MSTNADDVGQPEPAPGATAETPESPTAGTGPAPATPAADPAEPAPKEKKDEKEKKPAPAPAEPKPEFKKPDNKGETWAKVMMELMESVKSYQAVVAKRLGMDDKIKNMVRASIKDAIQKAQTPKPAEPVSDKQKADDQKAAQDAQAAEDARDLDKAAKPSQSNPYDFSQHLNPDPNASPDAAAAGTGETAEPPVVTGPTASPTGGAVALSAASSYDAASPGVTGAVAAQFDADRVAQEQGQAPAPAPAVGPAVEGDGAVPTPAVGPEQ